MKNIELLEPRYLFDGAAAIDVVAAIDSLNPDAIDTADNPELIESQLEQLLVNTKDVDTTNAVLFIDSNLSDLSTLLSDFNFDGDIVFLNSESNGLSQINEYLQDKQNISALHIVGHGSEDEILLGSISLTSENINAYKNDLEMIGGSLSEDADILLYGCNITSSTEGENLIKEFAHYTQADIAASDDLTGSETLNADWHLEYEVGVINSNSLYSANWHGSLHTNSVGFNIVNSGGNLTLHFFYGSWHNGTLPPEGALALYTYSGSGDRDSYINYTVEAYGNNGDISTAINGFTRSTAYTSGDTSITVGTINLDRENGSTTYVDADITRVGFILGNTYYWADSSALRDTRTGYSISSTYSHQWATINNVRAGTYRAFYDQSGDGLSGSYLDANGNNTTLSATWEPATPISQMIFTINADGSVSLGSSSNVSKSTNEDTPMTFASANFTDSFSGTLGKIKIQSLPSDGTLYYDADADGVGESGEEVSINDEINTADITNLIYNPDLNFNGSDSFTWDGFDTAPDPDAYTGSAANVNITVNSVNDAPTVDAPSTFTVTQDEASNLVFTGTPFADVDSGQSQTITLSAVSGVITGNAGTGITIGGTASARTFSGTISALNTYFTTAGKITYTASGSSDQTLTVQIEDAAAATASDTATLDVTPNTAPTISAPSSFNFTVDEESNLTFTGTPFADSTDTALVVTLAVNSGSITGNAGTGITIGGTASARTFSGTIANLNTYFTTEGKITYNGSSSDSQTLTITADDERSSNNSATTTVTLSVSADDVTTLPPRNQPSELFIRSSRPDPSEVQNSARGLGKSLLINESRGISKPDDGTRINSSNSGTQNLPQDIKAQVTDGEIALDNNFRAAKNNVTIEIKTFTQNLNIANPVNPPNVINNPITDTASIVSEPRLEAQVNTILHIKAAGPLKLATKVSEITQVAERSFDFKLPANIFIGGEGKITMQIKLNGQPLPDWISFNEQTGEIKATVPDNQTEPLKLTIEARDSAGNVVSTETIIEVNDSSDKTSLYFLPKKIDFAEKISSQSYNFI